MQQRRCLSIAVVDGDTTRKGITVAIIKPDIVKAGKVDEIIEEVRFGNAKNIANVLQTHMILVQFILANLYHYNLLTDVCNLDSYSFEQL